MSGFEAVKALRELGYKGYIFGVTATSDTDDLELFHQNGVTEVLFKPLNVMRLIEAIEKQRK